MQELKERLILSVGLYELSALCQKKNEELAWFWLVR